MGESREILHSYYLFSGKLKSSLSEEEEKTFIFFLFSFVSEEMNCTAEK